MAPRDISMVPRSYARSAAKPLLASESSRFGSAETCSALAVTEPSAETPPTHVLSGLESKVLEVARMAWAAATPDETTTSTIGFGFAHEEESSRATIRTAPEGRQVRGGSDSGGGRVSCPSERAAEAAPLNIRNVQSRVAGSVDSLRQARLGTIDLFEICTRVQLLCAAARYPAHKAQRLADGMQPGAASVQAEQALQAVQEAELLCQEARMRLARMVKP